MYTSTLKYTLIGSIKIQCTQCLKVKLHVNFFPKKKKNYYVNFLYLFISKFDTLIPIILE